MALLGGSLTMASIAALPVLIGLGVDYAIQFQSRFNEERGRAGRGAPAAAAAKRAGRSARPTIATAGAATATGFLVLLLPPVPMVRGFGLLLVIGIALAFACALTAGFAAMVLGEDGVGRTPPAPLRRLGGVVASAGARRARSRPGRRLARGGRRGAARDAGDRGVAPPRGGVGDRRPSCSPAWSGCSRAAT